MRCRSKLQEASCSALDAKRNAERHEADAVVAEVVMVLQEKSSCKKGRYATKAFYETAMMLLMTVTVLFSLA